MESVVLNFQIRSRSPTKKDSTSLDKHVNKLEIFTNKNCDLNDNHEVKWFFSLNAWCSHNNSLASLSTSCRKSHTDIRNISTVKHHSYHGSFDTGTSTTFYTFTLASCCIYVLLMQISYKRYQFCTNLSRSLKTGIWYIGFAKIAINSNIMHVLPI